MDDNPDSKKFYITDSELINANLLLRVPLELAKFANWDGGDSSEKSELLNPEIYAKCLFQFLSGKTSHKQLEGENIFQAIRGRMQSLLKERGIDNETSYDVIGCFFQQIIFSLTGYKDILADIMEDQESGSKSTYKTSFIGYLENYIQENQLDYDGSESLKEKVNKFIVDFKSYSKDVKGQEIQDDVRESETQQSPPMMITVILAKPAEMKYRTHPAGVRP